MPVALAEPPVGGLPPGTLFGRYACLSRLARGGMAELYLARHLDRPQLEKIWVIKRVLPHLAEDPMFVKMFQNEARLASTLDHPHVAAVVDYGVSGEEHYLVMEYVHGKDARALLREASVSGGLPMGCALTIVARVAEALHYAHERCDDAGAPLEIVHRDVSPSNVLVGYDGTVRIADFGIAKAVAQTNVTRTGTVKGKAGYMSPEQARGEPVDRRADVFGLGVLLYEMTTLRRAFFAASDLAIMSKVVIGDYRPPGALLADFPDELAAIIARALKPDPAHRYATAEAFHSALEAFATSRGHQLSSAALADTVTALFGSPPYPGAEFEDQVRTEVAASASKRGASWRLPVIAALAVGAGGFVLGTTLSEPEAAPAASDDRSASPLPAEATKAAEVDPPAEKATVDAVTPEAQPAPNAADPQTSPAQPVAAEATVEGAGRRKKKGRKSKGRGKSAETPKSFGPPKWGK